MAFPRNEQGPPRFTSVPLFGNLHLENCFEDNGIGGQQVLDLLVLEDNVFQRCLSQRSRGPTGASALTSCVISTPRLTCRSLLACRTPGAGPHPQVLV